MHLTLEEFYGWKLTLQQKRWIDQLVDQSPLLLFQYNSKGRVWTVTNEFRDIVLKKFPILKLTRPKVEKRDYLVDHLISFSQLILDENQLTPEIISTWHSHMKTLLNRFGFDDLGAEQLVKWGAMGHNWSKLHWDSEKSSIEYLKDFAHELYYCSDRMSLDRLFRCHWLFNGAYNAKNKETAL